MFPIFGVVYFWQVFFPLLLKKIKYFIFIEIHWVSYSLIVLKNDTKTLYDIENKEYSILI